MARYGKQAQVSVYRALRKYKRGKLHSGRNRTIVKSRKQAIAIGLSQARKQGTKVPDQKNNV